MSEAAANLADNGNLVVTAVLNAPLDHVEKYAQKYIVGPYRLKSIDRQTPQGPVKLTCLQGKQLNDLGVEGVLEIAAAHGLPLIDCRTNIKRWV